MMLDLTINFFIGLALIGVPSYLFYKIGIDDGIKRGIRLQIFREWKSSGVIDAEEAKKSRPK